MENRTILHVNTEYSYLQRVLQILEKEKNKQDRETEKQRNYVRLVPTNYDRVILVKYRLDLRLLEILFPFQHWKGAEVKGRYLCTR